MSTAIGANTPYVPYFNVQPQWVSMSYAQFEPACIRAVGGLPDSPYPVRKTLNHPNIFTFGRCAIGVYLSNPPATNHSPKPTSWRSIKRIASQAVSRLGAFDDEWDDGSTHGISINGPSGMQIAVYEKPFIDAQNKCGEAATYRANRSLTLEECLRQRAIEKGLLPPDPVAATVHNDDWDLSPQELSQQVNEYIRYLRSTKSTFVQSTEDSSEGIMAQITTVPTPVGPSSPALSPPPMRVPSPMPIASLALSPPTPAPLPPSPMKTKANRKKKKAPSRRPSSTSSTVPSGPTDFAGTPLEVHVLRTQWTRHGKLTPALCNRALGLFHRLYDPDDLRANHIAFTIPEFFVTSPCAVGVYLTYPDQEGLDTMVKDNWSNIEKQARLLALDVTNKGGAGGYVDLKSGVQIVIFDKPLLDPSATLQYYPNIPLAYALDQRIYARQHGGTTLPWTPKWHPTGYPTIQLTTVSLGSGNSSASTSLEETGVFVGLLDSWVADRDFSYANCLNAIGILTGYDRALMKPTLTLSQPIIISHDTCAIGIFVTRPPSAPHPAVNVIDTEDHDVLRYAISLVEIAVRGFRIGGFVDMTNGMQIAVWDKSWVDPGGVCGRISRVSLQDCLDKMVEYNGRMRKHATMLASLKSVGQTPASSQVAVAVSDLMEGASAVINQLLGQGFTQALTASTVPIDWPAVSLMRNPVFQITTAPAMLPGTGRNPFVGPTGAPLNPLENLMALRASEFGTLQTALAGVWDSISNRSIPRQAFGGPRQGSRARQSERLDVQHLGGVVLPGLVEAAEPRPSGMSNAPQIGDSYSSPKITKGVVVGEGAWVNQQAFLTATGYLTAGATGRVVMVGGDAG